MAGLRSARILLAGAALAGVLVAHDRPPDLVVLLADDLGWNELSAAGHPWHRTPALDRLAARGMTFSTAYAPAPNCAPSRASLLTGLYPPRHGIYTVGSSARGRAADRRLVPVENTTVLAAEQETLAELLAPAGYRCAAIGKWHLGEDPRTQGFHHAVAGDARGHPPTYHSPYRIPGLTDGPPGEHLTDRLADEAVAFLESLSGDEPCLLYLPFFAVHTPVQPPLDLEREWLERLADRDTGALELQRAARHAALVETMDRACGKVLDALERLGRGDHALVVFTSDNGPHARFSTAAPLRGSKGMLHEGGLRVPLVLRWPGRVRAASRSDVPVHLVDLVPTLLAAAAVEPPRVLDGVDLAPVLAGGTLPPRALHWHFPAYLEGYTPDQGPWRTTPAGAIRLGDHKLIEFFEDGRLEAYDLSRDPSESRPIDPPEGLLEALREWRRRTAAPMPTPTDPAREGR